MEVNLNDMIKVKLTKEGLKAYSEYNQECNNRLIDSKCNYRFNLTPRIDSDGYSTFQLWHFIQIFGYKMYVGGESVIEENKIIIGENK